MSKILGLKFHLSNFLHSKIIFKLINLKVNWINLLKLKKISSNV